MLEDEILYYVQTLVSTSTVFLKPCRTATPRTIEARDDLGDAVLRGHQGDPAVDRGYRRAGRRCGDRRLSLEEQ